MRSGEAEDGKGKRPRKTSARRHSVSSTVASSSNGAQKSKARSKRKPKGTGAASVHRALREEILQLKRAPGDLLDESELSLKFGVSRSPVREALIRLAAEGLVQTLANRSSIVARFDIEDLPSYFNALDLVYRATARVAAEICTEPQLAALRAIQAELETAHTANDALAIVQLNRDFHVAIAQATRNRWLSSWMSSLLDHGQRLMRLHIMHRRERFPLEQLAHHRAMIVAINARDGDAAEEAGRADAQIVRDQMIQVMSDQTTARIAVRA